ncbi:hypothetical protein [Enterococcus hulanensis]|uniref:hypothetical protein n=1 Tax=Enterococcus hulanensis TaxID=2559929 RepID=UPI0010FA1FE7|nr:hypothetical protein [Enterococcus hulanensis]
MKKKLIVILILLSLFPITACSTKEKKAETDPTSTLEASDKEYKALIKKAEKYFEEEEYNKSIAAYEIALERGGSKDRRIKKNIAGIKSLQIALDLKKENKIDELKEKITSAKILNDPENIAFNKLSELNKLQASLQSSAAENSASTQKYSVNSEQDALNLVNSKRVNHVDIKKSEGFDGTFYRFTFIEQGEEYRAIVNAINEEISFEAVNGEQTNTSQSSADKQEYESVKMNAESYLNGVKSYYKQGDYQASINAGNSFMDMKTQAHDTLTDYDFSQLYNDSNFRMIENYRNMAYQDIQGTPQGVSP